MMMVGVKANPMVADMDERTPLDIATERGHDECIRILEVSKS